MSAYTHERRVMASTKHGHGASGRHSPTYDSWRGMIDRCLHPNSQAFVHYGGRGITVCERWRSFENFLADMGERPSRQHSIERRENDGNYEPTNCRWATQKEQCRNTRSNHFLTFQDRTQCLTAWAEELGLSPTTIRYRLSTGLTVDQALTEPIHKPGTTGVLGVQRIESGYRVRLSLNGRRVSFGVFRTLDEAAEVARAQVAQHMANRRTPPPAVQSGPRVIRKAPRRPRRKLARPVQIGATR